MEEAARSSRKFNDLIEIAFISYGLGILIVNLHFARWGFYSFSLFKAQYVTAGLWFLFIIILGFLMNLIGRLVYMKSELMVAETLVSNVFLKKVLDLFFPVMAVGVFLAFFILVLWLIADLLEIQTRWGQLGGVLVILAGAPTLIEWAERFSEPSTIKPSELAEEAEESVSELSLMRLIAMPTSEIFMNIFILTITVFTFSHAIYRDIPVAIGGGRPISVKAVFSQEWLPQAAQLGLASLDLPQESGLLLLSETDTHYVFVVRGSSQAIQVDKDSVEALTFVPTIRERRY